MSDYRLPRFRQRDFKAISNGNGCIFAWILFLCGEVARAAFAIMLFMFYQHYISVSKTTSPPSGQRSHGIAYDGSFLLKPSPPNLPSILENRTTTFSVLKSIYGGKIDKPHLGGFTERVICGISPNAWNWMLGIVGVRSLLDVGCGRGHSSKFGQGSRRFVCGRQSRCCGTVHTACLESG